MSPDLSIVIINWNGLAVLRNCLNSIFGTPQGVAFEVIVVDNASDDNSVATLQCEFPDVKIIVNEQNRGFAAANNQAFASALGRYILLLNNDTIVLAGALVNSLKYMDSHPNVGALGCRCEFPDRSFQTSCYRFNDPLVLFMIRLLPLGSVKNEQMNFGRYWARQFTEPTEVDVVAGCYMVVRRDVIETVGGFDEDFFMYGEDEEWCSRIKRAGWPIIYFPGATIVHIHRFSSRKGRNAPSIVASMSPLMVLHKRRGFGVAWLGNIVLLLAFLVRLPIWLVQNVVHFALGSSPSGTLRGRFIVLAVHLKGLLMPVWLPRPKSASTQSLTPLRWP